MAVFYLKHAANKTHKHFIITFRNVYFVNKIIYHIVSARLNYYHHPIYYIPVQYFNRYAKSPLKLNSITSKSAL